MPVTKPKAVAPASREQADLLAARRVLRYARDALGALSDQLDDAFEAIAEQTHIALVR